jgi:hypothetical protein
MYQRLAWPICQFKLTLELYNLRKLNVVHVILLQLPVTCMSRPLVQVVTSAPVAWVTSFILTTSAVRTPAGDS